MSQEKKRLNKKKIMLAAGVAIAVLGIGGAWWWVKASHEVSTDDARVKGTIVSVSSKVPGRVEQVLVREGDSVQAGQVIARIETAELEVQVAQAKANLAAAQAKLAGLKAGSRPQQLAQSEAVVDQAAASQDNARKNYERIDALYELGAVSAQQRDAAKTALDVANAQYTSAEQGYSLTAEGSRSEDIQFAEAQVDQASAALKAAQLQLDNAIIKAPVSGVVALKAIDPGEFISPGQPLFSIADLNDVWVAANIEETYVGKVQIGQTVNVVIDAYSGKKLLGEVTEVGSATGSQFALLPMDNASGNYTKVTQRLPIKIKVNDAAGIVLKPGMSAVVIIHTS